MKTKKKKKKKGIRKSNDELIEHYIEIKTANPLSNEEPNKGKKKPTAKRRMKKIT